MKKLISMTEFVLQQNKEFPKGKPLYETDWEKEFEIFSKLMIRYAEFLKQPLTLGMFVPVDPHGNVLNEPFYDPANEQYWAGERFMYNTAKEKVLFEGFIKSEDFDEITVENRGLNIYLNLNNYMTITIQDRLGCGYGEIKTIEDLVKLDIELTPSSLKQIGL